MHSLGHSAAHNPHPLHRASRTWGFGFSPSSTSTISIAPNGQFLAQRSQLLHSARSILATIPSASMNPLVMGTEALGAAMRASVPMTNGFIEAEGIVAKMDLAECNSCERCAKNCPFGAIEKVGVEDGEKPKPHVLEALCKGCGLCAAECPKECIQIVHYSDEQILAQVDAALAENPEDKIVAFVCHWCALGAVDIAGVGRAEYPSNVRIIRVMCSARVAQDHVITALDKDAGGVLVAGCEFPTCHYITGNYKY